MFHGLVRTEKSSNEKERPQQSRVVPSAGSRPWRQQHHPLLHQLLLAAAVHIVPGRETFEIFVFGPSSMIREWMANTLFLCFATFLRFKIYSLNNMKMDKIPFLLFRELHQHRCHIVHGRTLDPADNVL